MYKLTYFILVVVYTVGSFGDFWGTASFLARYQVIIVIASGALLTLAWGLWTSSRRTLKATLLSIIPFAGPWIAFFMLVGETPDYHGTSRLYRAAIFIPAFLALVGFILVVPYLRDRANYSKGHQAYQEGECAVAIRYFDSIRNGWRLFNIGEYRRLSYPEWQECLYPSLVGKILLLDQTNSGLTLKARLLGSTDGPETVWEGPALSRLYGFAAVSPSGRYFFPYAEKPEDCSVVDMTTGAIMRLPLPGVERLGSEGIAGAFSPTDRFLAYSLTGDGGHTRSGLYLHDLVTRTTSTLFESPCARYSGGGGVVCGGIQQPLWINETTLVFNGYAGPMPDSISSSNFIVGEPAPNRTFVMTIDGDILQEMDPILSDWPIQLGGSTLVYSSGSGGAWLETADLIQGIIRPNAISGQRISLSPDGRFVLRNLDNRWLLTELRTNVDEGIEGGAMEMCSGQIGWSPDGKYVVCPSEWKIDEWNQQVHSLAVVFLKDSRSRTVLSEYESEWDFLLAWVP